jgi:DNA repair protein RecN (Recombination protein N)
MLEEIHIKDLGIIKEANLTFTRGLTTITGETGAGKTMVLTALALLLGKRSESSMIHADAAFTSVEGCWYVPSDSPVAGLVDNVGGVIEDRQLYINRTVHRDGKSKAVIGGKTTPASYLGEIGDNLVNIHGQSDQIKLKSATTQRDALDRYAGVPLRAALDKYRTAHATWTENTRTLGELRSNRAALQQEHETLLSVIAEIEKVEPVAGEDAALATAADRLTNIDEIRTNTLQAMTRISSDDYDAGDALTRTQEAIRLLHTIAGYDPSLASLVALAETASAALSELNSELNTYLSTIDTDSLSELNTIQERIAALATLKRHYGPTLDDVLARYRAAGERVLQIDPSGDHIAHLEQTVVAAHAEMTTLAAELSAHRVTAAVRLMAAVNTELAGLAMGNASFVVQVTPTEAYTRHGNDDIAFLLSAHHGAEPRPLGRGASGGELSRIMLAIEVVLADPDATPTFIFDEVDSGVGGATAIEIGKRLAQLATRAQVIVVTHLPQVAAFADNHLRVLKTNGEDFVNTDVTQLSDGERVTELARMLSGFADSDSAQAHAREMLEHAAAFKAN